MPDLLLELLSEEIPARMQAKAADDLKRLVTNGLVEAGLAYEGAIAFATPRRLALHVAGVPARSPDTREERKGPRVGAPEPAIQGFLRSAGLASIEEAEVRSDGKKGEFYVAVIARPGRPALEMISELVPQVVRGFPWPKSMRWGAASMPPGTPWAGPDAKGSAALRWVRPLHSILATFGPETEEPEIVPVVVDGIRAGDVTRGHRFHAPEPITVRRFEDYVAKLDKARVVLDPERRKRSILADAHNLAMAHGLELIEDPALLEEVAGLVEWPVVLLGTFDSSFLSVPAEVIRATIRANQKCFVLREADGRLSNRFILVANLEASDGGKAIVAGNERVVRARLSDAKYFWETDQRPLPDAADYAAAAGRLSLDLEKPLDQRMAKLAHMNVVFHEKLGTQGERVERIVALAREIAPLVGADPVAAARAAALAKADLVTEVVGEFPETQGLMGATYAGLQGEAPEVAAAIEEHYKPLGPSDRVPKSPVSVAVALADKLDTLTGFWAIDEKPTGSKDPYALRRAALGVIRLVLENQIRCSLLQAINFAAFAKRYVELARFSQFFGDRFTTVAIDDAGRQIEAPSLVEALSEQAVGLTEMLGCDLYLFDDTVTWGVDASGSDIPLRPSDEAKFRIDAFTQGADLLAFFHDRLKVQLREQGARHDLVDAVLSGDGGSTNDDLLLIVKRVEALGRFLETADGSALLAAYRRAANILRIEERKDGAYAGTVDATLLEARGLPEEKVLAHVLDAAVRHAHEHVQKEDFEGAMAALAELRPAVDAFFDRILVNDPDPELRRNRLALLARFRAATREVADFARIEG